MKPARRGRRRGDALGRTLGLALALPLACSFALASVGCGGTPPRAPTYPPLHLAPATDLAPAAALVWFVELHPKALFQTPETVLAVRELFPDARFQSFRDLHGGVDLRDLDELVVAGYPHATLAIARGVIDPAAVERAFATRMRVEGRGVDRHAGDLGSITRTWGTDLTRSEREQVATFGHEAVALEWGQLGPLRAAELFAQGKLHKAAPALRREPLDRAAEVVGDAPIRAFAPGPFEGEWAGAFGGLLGASTALALSARPANAVKGSGPGGALAIRLAVLGSWGKDADAAATRVAATLEQVSASALGHLAGLDHPLVGPTVHATEDAVVIDVTVDSLTLLRGVAAATGASVDDVMKY